MVGQVMVYSHQHLKSTISGFSHQGPVKQVLKEKCDACDAMHHTNMLVSQQVYFSPLVVSVYMYKHIVNNFVPISLVLAAGRAPPIA